MKHDKPQPLGTAPTASPSGLSRRRVVTTAATAAWAAPVIITAAAAPAFAASGGTTPAAIVTTVGTVRRDPVNLNDVIVPITFINNGGPTTSLLADVRVTALAGGINSEQPVVRSTGWGVARPATFAQFRTMDAQFTKLAPQIGGSPGADSTSVLEFTFNGFFTNGFLNGNITVTPTVAGAPGSTAAPTSQAFEVSPALP